MIETRTQRVTGPKSKTSQMRGGRTSLLVRSEIIGTADLLVCPLWVVSCHHAVSGKFGWKADITEESGFAFAFVSVDRPPDGLLPRFDVAEIRCKVVVNFLDLGEAEYLLHIVDL
jgi:hypothetical protein